MPTHTSPIQIKRNKSQHHQEGTNNSEEKKETTANLGKPTYSGVIPAILIAGVNAYNLWNEHWEHWSHMPPLEERVEYPYQNIRSKNFPWGDGDKTILYVLPTQLNSHHFIYKLKTPHVIMMELFD